MMGEFGALLSFGASLIELPFPTADLRRVRSKENEKKDATQDSFAGTWDRFIRYIINVIFSAITHFDNVQAHYYSLSE